MDLRAAGIDAFEVNGIAGRYGEARRKSAVPAGVSRLRGKTVLGQGGCGLSSLNFDAHLQFDQRVAWQRGNANGSAHVAGGFAENVDE